MFRVSAPLLSRQWTPKQIRFFRKQRLQSAAAQQRKKSLRPKYMPSWTRHDIWLDEGSKSETAQPNEQIIQNIQTTTRSKPTHATNVKSDSKAPQTQQDTNPPPTEEKKEEKKSRFKFW